MAAKKAVRSGHDFKSRVQSVLSELGVKTVQPSALKADIARCKPTAHRFLPVRIPKDATAAITTFHLKDTIKLFCQNCGEMRPIE